MKKGKEIERKKSWDQVFNQKEVLCCSALLYIGILVTSTTTMMAKWLVHLLHKQKVGVQFPVVARAFFPTSIFYLPCPTSVE